MTKFNKKKNNNTQLHGGSFFNNDKFNVEDRTQDYEAKKEKFLQKQQEQKEQKHIDKKVNEIFNNIIEEFKRDNDQDDQIFDFSNIKKTETNDIFKFEGFKQQQSTQKHNIEEIKKFNFGENTPDTQAHTPNDSEQGDNYENNNINSIKKDLMEKYSMINKENNTAKELDEKIVDEVIKEITQEVLDDEIDDENYDAVAKSRDNIFDNVNKQLQVEEDEIDDENYDVIDKSIDSIFKKLDEEIETDKMIEKQLDDEIENENGEGDGETFYDCEDIEAIEKINESTGTTTEEKFYDSINPWKAYINHNKANNKTFEQTVRNLTTIFAGKENSNEFFIEGVKLNDNGELKPNDTGEKFDIYNEKLWAGGRFLLRFDTPDGADKFLASIDTSALYRREAATHGSEYDGKFLVEKKESGISALFKGLFYGTHYGSDLQNPNGSIDGQSPGHLYINKENYTLTYYASKIPFIGSQFEKNHYSEIQIGIENHAAPGVWGLIKDKAGIEKAAHSTSGESDGINPIGDAKNIYKVKLDKKGNIKNQDGLNKYLEKAGVTDVESSSIKLGDWKHLNENDDSDLYQYQKVDIQDKYTNEVQSLYFVKDPKGNVFVANPETLNNGENVIFDINGKTINVDAKKVEKLKSTQEDSLTLKDTRDFLHAVIIAPKAYGLVKDIAKNVFDPLPKVFGFNNFSDYSPDVVKHYSNMADEYAVNYGNMALDTFNYGFNTIIEKPVEYIKLVDNYLGEYPSSIAGVPYENIIKPMVSDGLNATFNAMNFYLDGYSVFVNPFINSMTNVIDNQVEQYAPDDKSSTAYNYGYNTAYAGYSFGKHFMLHANNTGTYKTTYSSEKFANSVGKTIGDVNRINNIEKEIQGQDVGYATYIADAGVIYSLSGNSTMPTEKKWLPIKVATSIISFTPKMFTFYSAHSAIKYIDNSIGISSGSAKLLSYANPFSYFDAAKLLNYEYLPSYFSTEINESVVDNVKNNIGENTVAKNVNISINTKTIQSDDTQEKVYIEQNSVEVYEEIYTMNDDNEYMGLENDMIGGNDIIEDPCASDELSNLEKHYCIIKDDPVANDTLWN